MTWPEERIVWWPLMSTARCLPRDCAGWWSRTLVLPTGVSPHFASAPCVTCSVLVTSKRQHFLLHERVRDHPESPPLAVSPEVPQHHSDPLVTRLLAQDTGLILLSPFTAAFSVFTDN